MLINDPERRAIEEKAERERTDKEHRDRLEQHAEATAAASQATAAATVKQTKAQELQVESNKRIAFLTGALVFVSLVSAGVSVLQFIAANNSADAANRSAKVAEDTLAEMRASGNGSAHQTNQLIGNMNWLARTNDNSLRQNLEAIDSANKRAEATFKLQMRPFAIISGLTETPLVIGKIFFR